MGICVTVRYTGEMSVKNPFCHSANNGKVLKDVYAKIYEEKNSLSVSILQHMHDTNVHNPLKQRFQLIIQHFSMQLDGQGRARREAARRRKSEWKVNVAIPNSSRSNGSWQVTPKTVSLSIVEPRGVWTCVSLQCTSTSGGSICAL